MGGVLHLILRVLLYSNTFCWFDSGEFFFRFSTNLSWEFPEECWSCTIYDHMGVSKNNVTPKSSILIGFFIIFTIHFGFFPPIFGNTHMMAVCLAQNISHWFLLSYETIWVGVSDWKNSPTDFLGETKATTNGKKKSSGELYIIYTFWVQFVDL